MVTYTVYFKKMGNLFWSKIKDVKADMFVPDLQARVFITKNEIRYEVPFGHIFKFSKERFFAITQEERKQVNVQNTRM